jgi:enhancing lycopene biosynthesis protein 2
MSKRVAVVLSGCGVYDGSEIYESTLTLLHLVASWRTGAVFCTGHPPDARSQSFDWRSGFR